MQNSFHFPEFFDKNIHKANYFHYPKLVGASFTVDSNPFLSPSQQFSTDTQNLNNSKMDPERRKALEEENRLLK